MRTSSLPPFAWAGIAAVLVDVAAISILTAVSDTHPLHDYVSTLGVRGAPTAPYYVAAGQVAAALHLVFVYGLWKRTEGRLATPAALLLGSFFVLQWLSATIFPCDPGCALLTTTGRIHYGLGVAAFVTLGLATIAYAVMGLQRWLAGIAVATELTLLVFDQLQLWRGLFERLAFIVLGIWWIAIALQFTKDPVTPRPAHT